MKSRIGGLYAALSSMGLLLSGCEESKSVFDKTVEAMGGAALEAATLERTVGTGGRYDPGESPAPGKNYKKADITTDRLLALEGRRSHTRHQISTNALFPLQMDFTEIVNGDTGYVDGVDAAFGGSPRSAMDSARLASREREAWLFSPSRLLKLARRTPQHVTQEQPVTREGKRYEAFSVLTGPGAIYKVLVDPATSRVARVETLEDHPPLGDVVISATYEDYKEVNGVQVPGRVTVRADGDELQDETRTELALPASATEEQFAVPADFHAEFNEADSLFGSRYSQWGIGFGVVGFNYFYGDQGKYPVTFEQVAPGAQVIGGTNHNQMLLEMSDHLVLVDAPLYESRSLAVLAEIKKRYPNKPIRYVVLTHFHYDHSGGLRTFLAEGNVTVLVHTISAGFVEQVLERPHTVAPDRYELNKVPVTVRAVSTLERLTDSAGKVVELHKVASSHSEDMLVVYVPETKLLLETDLFIPNPYTNGQPGFGRYATWSGELYDEVVRLGLPVEAIAGGHGQGTATLEHLRIAGGK